MTRRMSFVVEGEAIPQGSVSAYVRGGRAIVTSDNPRLKQWRRKVSDAAIAAMPDMGGLGDQPVAVFVEFQFVRPASVKAEKRPLPSVRPDVDKLARAVLDALTTSGVVSDDSRVVELLARKVYGDDERATVVVVGVDHTVLAPWSADRVKRAIEGVSADRPSMLSEGKN